MGTWDIGPFENDMAADFAFGVVSAPRPRSIRRGRARPSPPPAHPRDGYGRRLALSPASMRSAASHAPVMRRITVSRSSRVVHPRPIGIVRESLNVWSRRHSRL
ncbi:DUF4259 domain-containing protein [Embleya sp. NPDC001921]